MPRAVTTVEAGAWLTALISKRLGQCEPTSVHALKGAPLSWCGNLGLAPEVRLRLLLGRRTSGTSWRILCVNTKECYNRSIPGQAFSEEVQPDPKLSKVSKLPEEPAEAQEEQEASSESSSSPSESESSVVAHMDEQEAAEEDAVVRPSRWEPDVLMYQRHRSLIVHVMACGSTNNRFSCGNPLTSDYSMVKEVPFLALRKCKKCELARPIKDVGAFASALKKQRLERDQE